MTSISSGGANETTLPTKETNLPVEDSDVFSRESVDVETSISFPQPKPWKLCDFLWGKLFLLLTAFGLTIFHHRRLSTSAHTLETYAFLRPVTKSEDRCNAFSTSSKFTFTRAAPGKWQEGTCTIYVNSTMDYTLQPAIHYAPPESVDPELDQIERPLLVALHTWSTTYTQDYGGEIVYSQWAMDHQWHFLHPHFRGQNWKSDACGSELAVQDIMDAVDAVKEKYAVDSNRIYLVGVSGGGHMATLLAGRHPEVWAGVSAWAPISDIQAWWSQREGFALSYHQLRNRKYANFIEQVVGGKLDGSNVAALESGRNRSPVTYLSQLQPGQVNLDINAGITDGRSGGSVPFTHAMYAYDAACTDASGKIGSQAIESFYSTQDPPADQEGVSDPLYDGRAVYFRRVCGSTRVTIFEGGHEIVHQAALNWLKLQRLGKEAQFGDMNEKDIDWIESTSRDSHAGS